MQLQFKPFNSITAMETSNIKADFQTLNSDDELSLCINAIGESIKINKHLAQFLNILLPD